MNNQEDPIPSQPAQPLLPPNPTPESPPEPSQNMEPDKTHFQEPAPNSMASPEPPINPPHPSPIAPPPPDNTPASPAVHANTPGIIVLQWLTYAFWGWTVLAMSILTGIVLASFKNGKYMNGSIPYVIAATLVLLPISVVCDHFYSKYESHKKTGPSSIVMVIYAVLFALFCIGALISIVIIVVELFIGNSTWSTLMPFLFTAIIVTILYAATFLRTIHPTKPPWLHKAYLLLMVASVGVITVIGIIGPVENQRATRNDRLIDNNLSDIQNSINEYESTNNQLPSSLTSLSLYGDDQTLANSGLLKYIPNSIPPTQLSSPVTAYSTNAKPIGSPGNFTYYYQLCVTYKKAGTLGTTDPYADNSNANGYSSNIDTEYHPAGYYCYKGSTY